MIKHLKISPKYRTKPASLIGYYALILTSVFLILGYLFDILRIEFIIKIYPDFYYHVSNLSLSVIVYSGIGLSWIIQGVNFKYVVLLGLALIVANVLCETIMGFMNTTDLIDALTGVIGVAISFVYLMLTTRHGLFLTEEINK